MIAKPFIKWVGGKTQLLPEIKNHYPEGIKKYCEPFIGGGAVLFDVLQTLKIEEVLINDINPELINTYDSVKTDCEGLINELKDLESSYISKSEDDRKLFYYSCRDEFNTSELNLRKASLFIFLNKTCFNGLYRVNAKGLFNVPMGGYKKPLICDEENLRACSELLNKVQLHCGDYSFCKDFIDDKTFVYIDPPYRPLTKSSSFTSYNETGFDDTKQIELGNFIQLISDKGAKIVASNSDPKNTNPDDDFFDTLYEKFTINRVDATRMINSNSSKRGRIKEILISNF